MKQTQIKALAPYKWNGIWVFDDRIEVGCKWVSLKQAKLAHAISLRQRGKK